MSKNPEHSQQRDGCLPAVFGVAVLAAATIEERFLNSDWIMNYLVYEPIRRTNYENQQLNVRENDKLSDAVERYSTHLLQRKPGGQVIHQLPIELIQAVNELKAKVEFMLNEENLGYKRFDNAIRLVGDAEMTASNDGSSQHIWPSLSQLKGSIHEEIAQQVNTQKAKKYWFAQAIQAYITADIFNQSASDQFIANPVKVRELMTIINQITP